jgi:predicted dehydrogenase
MTAAGLVILGCGRIARRHAAAARRLGVPMIFGSRDPGRARAYAREFGALAGYGSYGEALRDPRAVGAVICTPHACHLDDVLAALAADRHVLVEKPMARTLEEADHMIGAAARAGRVLMVAEQFHFMPAFRRVKRLIDEGHLGPLRELHLVARGFHGRSGWRLDAEASGGGALIDGGIHYVHNLRWWGGGVRRVFALRPAQTVMSMAGEDSVSLLAELPAGGVGFLCNSLGAPGVGKFQWSTVTGAGATCFVDNRGRAVLLRSPRGLRPWVFGRDIRGYVAMLTVFLGAIARRQPPEMDGLAGRADLAVVHAAYRSIAERCPVDLPC